MKIFILLAALLLLAYSPPQNTAYEKVRALAKAFPENTEVSIGITDHGKPYYIGFIKSKGRLVLIKNSQKVFGIASITKLFTCALIADLVVKNKIELTDDINQYYPFRIRYSGDAKGVTIAGLCTHTSGLPADGYGVEGYLKAGVRLSFEGGKYRYSNLGFMILGDILEKVTQKDYSELLTERILQPLQMKSTGIDLMNVEPRQLAKGNAGKQQVQTRFRYEGVGSVKSNVVDMLRFLDDHFNNVSALRPAFMLMQKEHAKKDANESMGLGWHILKSQSGSVYYHQGFLSGYTAEIRYALKKKRGVVVLSNLSGQGPYASSIEKIAAICLEAG